MAIDRLENSAPLKPIKSVVADRRSDMPPTLAPIKRPATTSLNSAAKHDLSQLREAQFHTAQKSVAEPALKKLGNRMLQMWRLLPTIESPDSFNQFTRLGKSLNNVIGTSTFDGDTIIAQDLTLKLDPNRAFHFNAGSVSTLPVEQSYTATVSIKGKEPTQLILSYQEGWQTEAIHQSEANPLRINITDSGELNAILSKEELLIAQGVVSINVSANDTGQVMQQEVNALKAAKHPILSLSYADSEKELLINSGPIIQDGLRTIKAQLQVLNTSPNSQPQTALSTLSKEEALAIGAKVEAQLDQGFKGIHRGITVLQGLSDRLLNVLRS
ncbi:hypothetical protein [uncultured Umboniibacter sp.]|uniref:hypothetical protein n=1 Tax=uncultured Umboniibacter sp. TaxID=1798917 RepID=UPI00261ABFA9|nr:hypothetical protein [uncultured Umboniibacter sp.]